jgi:hypothetical protein
MIRDCIIQAVYVLVTAILQLLGTLLDAVGVPIWLRTVIHHVFDGLTVVALAQLTITIGIRMFRGIARAIQRIRE